MKRYIITKLSVLALTLATVGFVACTKETADNRLAPNLATTQVIDITSNSATIVGYIIAGTEKFTKRGVCYSTTPDPTINNDTVHWVDNGEKKATFQVTISGLTHVTTYYAKAYAKLGNEVKYGEELSFTTLPILPTVTTADITDITSSSAKSGGEVTDNGGATVTARGVCWSTLPNPTIANEKTTDDNGDGTFTSSITGLMPNTTYYVRAYATNSAGTAYGEQKEFTTLNITKFWVVGDYNGWDNSDNAKYIISSLTSGNQAEGYVYLTAGGIKLVTDHSWSDLATFGDDGAYSGILANPGVNIPVASDGYYRIRANRVDMTYELLKTEWGIIGSATPGGWGDETPLQYDQTLDLWFGGMHLTDAEVKFRANNNWEYNLGGEINALSYDGANIPIDLENDYAITLDLSTPNEYKCSINRWGIIGSATADGWNSDQDMTWDADNGVFTATLDLVAGEIKFRANDSWDYNLGGPLNAIEPDGANIPISADGNYTITLNPWTKVATITMN
ncbi:MAG TPA: SusF/SusE family outer membrane protein [Bacteroidales bacterium]|nr:SusF/SusE family outer membrane protein [Bacteroidales bacterium]